MKLTHEDDQLRTAVKRWVAEQVNPHVDQWESEQDIPSYEVFKQIVDLGLLGLCRSVDDGGLGLDHSFAAVLAETLADINCGRISMEIGLQTDMATPVLGHRGSAELRAEFLAPAISVEFVACLGVCEVGSGSDVASIKTTALKNGGDYVISGGKIWTTNGTKSNFCVVLANTSEGAPHRNKSLIVVPMKSLGVEVAKKIRKMGMYASDIAQLHFDDLRVPQRYCIGEEGMGVLYRMEQFQVERLWGAMNNCGMAQRAIDLTIEFTRERRAFGCSILDNQTVHYKLAEFQAELDCLRAVCWSAVDLLVQGQDATCLATVVKFKAGRLIRTITDGCLQFWGGMGFADESPNSRMHRDGRLTSIGGRADEVMFLILSKYMGILPKAA
jgi:citronellyl-CoA dehydrogenase